MVKELGRITTLEGKTGSKYEFSLWTFDDFDDIKSTFSGGGLYLFTRRSIVENEYKHSYLYLGETGDFFTRFNNHHKEACIKQHNANCIGFFSVPNSTEQKRKEIEEDILSNYNFPCNTSNN